MRRLSATVDWLRRYPLVPDSALALLVLVPTLSVPAEAPEVIVELTPGLRWLAVVGCVALAFRRRWPVPVWLVTMVPAVGAVIVLHGPSGTALPLLVALYTIGARQAPWTSVGIGAASGATLATAQALAPDGSWATTSTWGLFTWCLLATMIGVAVRSQRRAVAAARERARVAEESREEEARRRVSEERLRIARDLHDVVAHHIAVISVQSGVAEHLLDEDPPAARAAIEHVRTSSREVLSEMSTLLGVLRTGEEPAVREPAHGLADLDELVESFRRAGLRVRVRQEGELAPLAPLVDLTAYRVLEEALTNASKHGLDGSADVTIAQSGSTTALEVRNRTNDATPADATGHGLIGMRERVIAIGGVLAAGADGRGSFVVHAELPTVVPLAGAS